MFKTNNFKFKKVPKYCFIFYFVIFNIGFFCPQCLSQAIDELDERAEVFVYERNDRRDPLISLIDKAGGVKESSQNKEAEMMESVATVKVGGILWDEDMPLAMINNDIHKIGDVVNRLTVKDITADSVTFGYEDLSHTITIIEKKDF
jgi:hypothetical protein